MSINASDIALPIDPAIKLFLGKMRREFEVTDGARRLPALALALALLVACSPQPAPSGDKSDNTQAVDSPGVAPDGASPAAAPGQTAAIVPEGLQVIALPGGNGVLEVTALTLRRGPTGVELLAALQNRGDRPACSAAFGVELFDREQRSITAAIGGLLSQRFYRRTDGSDAIAACVGPADVTMVVLQDLPTDLPIQDVQTIVYRCPYFALDVVAVAGLVADQVAAVATAGGTAYRGSLRNGFDVTVLRPSVTIFAIDVAGRPTGMAIAQAEDGTQLAPGGRWSFETVAIPNISVKERYAVYPAGALQDMP